MHSPYRVLTFNEADLQALKEKFLKLKSPDERVYDRFIEEDEEYVDLLLGVQLPQYIANRASLEFDALLQRLYAEWANEFQALRAQFTDPATLAQEEQTLLDRLLAELRRQLDQAKQLFSNATYRALIQQLDNINGLDDIRRFLAEMLKKRSEYLEESDRRETVKDLHRSIFLDNKLIANASDNEVKQQNDFREKLGNKGVEKALVEYLLRYLNQRQLILGANFMARKIAQLQNFGIIRGPDDSVDGVHHIEVESRNTVIITYTRDFEHFHDPNGVKDDRLFETEAKSFLRYHIELLPGKSPPEHIKTTILGSYAEIYRPDLRKAYVDFHSTQALERIRRGSSLTTNHHRIIDLFLADYKKPNQTIDAAKLENISDKALFLLMWSNSAHAEDLLVKDFSPLGFFARHDAIVTDMVPPSADSDLQRLIQNGQITMVNGELRLGIDRRHPDYRELSEKFKKYKALSIDPDLQPLLRRGQIKVVRGELKLDIPEDHRHHKLLLAKFEKFKLCLIEKRLMEIISRDLTLLMQKHDHNSTLVAGCQNYLSLLGLIQRRDVERIATQMVEAPINMIRCLYTIKDADFILSLLSHKRIKNHLDADILTHFALLDQRIAENILDPPEMEKISFVVRKGLGRHRGVETIAKDQLRSSHLVQIVDKHPQLWNTLFATREKNKLTYRYALSGSDLAKLVDINRNSLSVYQARREIYDDPKLKNKLFYDTIDPAPGSQRVRFTKFEDELAVITINEKEHLSKLALEPDTWAKIHTDASDDQLAEFYEKKFELEFRHRESNLLKALEDLWSDRRDEAHHHTAWVRKIPHDRKELVKNSIIKAISINLLRVETSEYSPRENLPQQILMAEVFLTKPFTNGFRPDSFTDEGLHTLQRALLENWRIFGKLFDDERFKVRFKAALSGRDEFLFDTTWQLLKKETDLQKQDARLIEMLSIKLPANLQQWLMTHKRIECPYLIKKLITSHAFYQAFCRQPDGIKEILLGRASLRELTQLLINCQEMGVLYLMHPRDNFLVLIEQLNAKEMGLMLVKYPNFIQKMKAAGCFDDEHFPKLQEVIQTSLADTHLSLSHHLEMIKNNVNRVTKAQIEARVKLGQVEASALASKRDEEKVSEIATGFVSDLQDDPEKHISALMHPDILFRLLGAVTTVDNKEVAAAEELVKVVTGIGKIVSLLQRKVFLLQKAPLKVHFDQLINVILQRVIIEPTFLPILSNKLIVKSLNSHGNLQLLVTLLVTRQLELGPWFAGLTRVAKKDITLFEKALPELIDLPGFGEWLVQQDNEIRTAIYRSNKRQALNAKLVASLTRGYYEGKDLAGWLAEEYGGNISLNVPSVRALLLGNAVIRAKFCKKVARIPSETLALVCNELKLDFQSVLAAEILSDPLLGFLLEKAKIERIEDLLEIVETQRLRAQHNAVQNPGESQPASLHDVAIMNKVVAKLLALAVVHPGCREKLLASNMALGTCFFYAFSVDEASFKKDVAAVILQAFTADTVSLALPNLLMATEFEKWWRCFTPDQRCAVIPHILRHAKTTKHPSLISIVKQMMSFDFDTLLTLDISPTLQQQLLCCLFTLSREPLADEGIVSPEAIRGYLQRSMESGVLANDAFLAYLQDGLDGDALAELHIADGIELSSGKKFLFGSMFTYDKYQDLVFLFAKDTTLMRLFNEAPAVSMKFLQRTKTEERPTVKEKLLARIITCMPGFIWSLNQRDCNPKSLIELMDAHPTVYQHVLATFKAQPDLLLSPSQANLSAYLAYLIHREALDDLIPLMNQPQLTKPIALWVSELLLPPEGQRSDPNVVNALLKQVEDPEESALALMGHLIDALPRETLVRIIRKETYPDLYARFIDYIKSHPEKLAQIFKRDMAPSFLPHPIHPIADFWWSLDKLDHVTVYDLIQREPQSDIAVGLDDYLIHQEIFGVKAVVHVLNTVNSTDLARLYNIEARKKGPTPFLDVMFETGNEKYIRKMLRSLRDINDDVVYGPRLRAVLTSDVESASLLMANFNLQPFRLTSGKRANEQHYLAFLHARRCLCRSELRRIRNESEYEQRFRIYHDYIEDFDKVTVLSQTGELCFRDLGDSSVRLPNEHAVEYVKALSIFFHKDFDNDIRDSVKKLMDNKPQLCRLVINSLKFREDGSAAYRYGIDDEVTREQVTPHYLQMVLYAHCVLKISPNELSPVLKLAFLKNVNIINGVVVFSGTQQEIPEGEAFIRSLLLDLLCGRIETNDSDILSLFVGFPEKDLFEVASETFCHNFLRSVYVDSANEMRYRDNGESVSPAYRQKVCYLIINKSIQFDFNGKIVFAGTTTEISMPLVNLVRHAFEYKPPDYLFNRYLETAVDLCRRQGLPEETIQAHAKMKAEEAVEALQRTFEAARAAAASARGDAVTLSPSPSPERLPRPRNGLRSAERPLYPAYAQRYAFLGGQQNRIPRNLADPEELSQEERIQPEPRTASVSS